MLPVIFGRLMKFASAKCSLAVLTLIFFIPLFGQEAESPADTALTRDQIDRPQLEGPIKYEAQDIEILFQERIMILTGRARVQYLDMDLKAAKITLEMDNDLMTAEGVLDTVWVSQGDEDSVKTEVLTGKPEFLEGGDLMVGEKMTYNFRLSLQSPSRTVMVYIPTVPSSGTAMSH